MQVAAFRGTKGEFGAYLAGMKSGRVVDINWHRKMKRDKKKRTALKAALKKSINPSIA